MGRTTRAGIANHEEEGCGWAKDILEAIALGSCSQALPVAVAQMQAEPGFRGVGVWSPTYTEEEALVFLDGPQAAQEARHHDNGSDGDD